MEIRGSAICRHCQPAAAARFCNDRIGGGKVEGVTGRKGQQTQPVEAEEECLRGRMYLEWDNGTANEACRVDSRNGRL